MADFAGAVAAIKARLAAAWTTTPIGYQNERAPTVIVDGASVPWVYCEVLNSDSELHAAGKPGSRFWIYDGQILLHVFVPVGTGDVLARQYAETLGNIFRGAGFYNETPPDIVRCWSPWIDGGDSGSDDGLWWRVTVTIPFEYWHQA